MLAEGLAQAEAADLECGVALREILSRDPRSCTGNTFIDDGVLAEAGIVDLDPYAGTTDGELALDIFVDGWPDAVRG